MNAGEMTYLTISNLSHLSPTLNVWFSFSPMFQRPTISRSLQEEERTSGTAGEQSPVKDGQSKVKESRLKTIYSACVRACNYLVSQVLHLQQPALSTIRQGCSRPVCLRPRRSRNKFLRGISHWQQTFPHKVKVFGAVISTFLLDPSLQWSDSTRFIGHRCYFCV